MSTRNAWGKAIVCDRIATRRRLLGMSQQELGEACGYRGRCAQTTVHRWECGVCMPPLDTIRRLATVLNLPLDLLVP